MANYNMNQTVTGLGTIATVTVPTTDRYTLSGKISVPKLPKGSLANSSVVAVINVNGSPIYTGQAGAEGFESSPFCSAGDIITVVLSSANVVDQGLNVIKTTLSISESVA